MFSQLQLDPVRQQVIEMPNNFPGNIFIAFRIDVNMLVD